MAITRTRGISVFALVSIGGLLLTGCTSSGDSASGSDQSVNEACTILIDGMTEMEASIMENAEEIQTDPEAGDAAFAEFNELFQKNAAQVTNEDVKPSADEISAIFVRIGEAREVAAANPADVDQQAMTTIATDLQDATTKLDEICQAG
ncbi:MAG TPA: hypothetical protein VGP24_17520 [Glaciihabitans sp.]|jgi:hypothetical protein|nr:hypothetical protein [Glaciihabitans sp.]